MNKINNLNSFKKRNTLRYYVLTIMRIFLLLITIGLGSAFANSTYSQTKITINVNEISFEELFKEIQSKSEFVFFYKDDIINSTQKLSLKLKKATLQSILNKAFSNTNLSYTIDDRQVVIKEKAKINIKTIKEETPQGFELKGTITDSNNQPLAGANILEKGTTNGAQTDFDGNFSLTVADGNATLVVSYLGFATTDVAVNNKANLAIVLQEDSATLDEVVLIGYGSQRKSSLTASVSVVDTKETSKLSTHDAATALQGRATGVYVESDGGIAGASANIIIRGTGSLTNATPLYVIDGAFANNMSFLNPDDIASIQVLKDASASAIYGSRAANGVVLITTKKGSPGETKYNISVSAGVQSASKKLNYLSASQYADVMNRAADNAGIPRAIANDSGFNSSVNEDYQDLWLRNGDFKSVAFSASGGSENSRFNASLGYYDQNGIIINNSFKRYNVRFNSEFTSGRFKLTERLSASFANETPQLDYRRFNIPTIAERDADGNYSDTSDPDFYITNPVDSNPYARGNLIDRYNKDVNLIGGLGLEVDIIEGLKYKVDVNFNYTSGHAYNRIPNHIKSTGSSSGDPSLSETNLSNFNYVIDNLLTYSKTFNEKHNFDFLLGTSWNKEQLRSTTIIANDFPSDIITVANGSVSTTGIELESGLLSYFGRINYNFDDIFLLSASVRRDESSKFGLRDDVFPGISAGINLHNLGILPEDGLINTFKIRGGYGELGNSAGIMPYLFTQSVRSGIPTTLGGDGLGLGSVVTPADANLTWETAKSFDIGIDLELLDRKITFSANYFKKQTSDLLAALSPPPTSGQTFDNGASAEFTTNGPSIDNTGIEFSTSYRKTEGDFTFNITANLSTLKNEVTSLGGFGVQPIRGYVWSGTIGDRATLTDVGLAVGTFYGYEVDGYYSSDAEADSGPESGSGKGEGDFIFKDINGDGVVNTDDRTDIGSPFPNFEYGLNFSGNYKNWDFTLFFQGISGNEILNHNKYENYFNYSYNLHAGVLNSYDFNPSNPSGPRLLPSNYTSANNGTVSSWFVEDGSYLRLKNLQVGYTFNDLKDKLKVSNLRAYIGVQNLFTISNYSGYDPEVGSGSSSGVASAATDGRTEESNIIVNRGVDSRSIPRDRTILVGLQLSL